jgi:DNA-binding beta-propeller fold protein YncE
MKNNISCALGLIGLSVVSGCGGGSNNAVTTVPTAHLAITLPAGTVEAGTPFTFTVSALDATNAAVPTYVGTVQITTSDKSATLPANATLTQGKGTFTVTFGTVGSYTITASDAVGNATAGTSAAVSVSSGHFAIGGMVTGLSGSGLVLQNNGGDDLLVTATGAFTFTGRLANGTAYAVTVKTQPSSPTQYCVVTNGSGTVGTANITNVTVACTASTGYTVGGTITGLMGSGLVLRNNGSDDLVVTAAGTFTFSASLATGASYVVTVSTQPSGPPQKCVVANGSGTVGTANITNVTVACTASKGYTVGGTVTGLTGSGLVLGVYDSDPNSGWSLAVSAAGTFVFPVQFAQGATYFVEVDKQPTSPIQLCIVTNGGGTIGTANVTDVAVVCSSAGRFAYAANAGDNTISAYSIDPTTGALTALGTPVATGTSPYAITGSPDRKHLYVVNQLSNDISVYAVNATTGALTPISGSPFAAGTDPQALAFAPSGAYLYVANRGSDNLSAYAVDTSSGALTLLPTPTYPTGSGPSAVLVEPSGNVVYVANNGGSNNVSTFLITAGTGELTPVAGSPFDVGGNPHGLAFEQGALLTANSDGVTSSISVMGDLPLTGKLLANGPPRALPAKYYMATDHVGSGLLVATGLGVDLYWNLEWDLAHIARAQGASGANVYSVTVDPSDQFIYVCNDGSANVSGYLFGGALTPIPGSPFPAGHHPDFIAVL